jgi:hypothetical protein
MGSDILCDIAKPENGLYPRGDPNYGTMNCYQNLAGNEKIVGYHIFQLFNQMIIYNFFE